MKLEPRMHMGLHLVSFGKSSVTLTLLAGAADITEEDEQVRGHGASSLQNLP
jgi:hypothetical protein